MLRRISRTAALTRRASGLRSKLAVLVVSLLVLPLLGCGSYLGSYTVGNSFDGVSPTPNCSSTTNQTCTLRDAIAVASLNYPVVFKAGIGPITLSQGVLVLNKSVDIVGPGSTRLAVDGGSTPSTRLGSVFQVNAGVSATITGLTIRNGASAVGGGIANYGSLALSDVIVDSNNASFDGGGLYNTGTLTIKGSTVSNNSALTSGGGIMNGGALTVTDSIVKVNNAFTAGGGIWNGGSLTVTGSTVSKNSTTGQGGGIFNRGPLVTLQDDRSNPLAVNDNTAGGPNGPSSAGGGIYNAGGSVTLTVSGATTGGVTVNKNSATGQGGGIYNGDTLVVANGTGAAGVAVDKNAASDGGGIYNAGGTVTLTIPSNGSANEVNDNTVTGQGGGIYNAGGTVTLTGAVSSPSTVDRNTAGGDGGGLYNTGRAGISFAQFHKNAALDGGAIFDTGTATTTLTSVTFAPNNSAPPCEPTTLC